MSNSYLSSSSFSYNGQRPITSSDAYSRLSNLSISSNIPNSSSGILNPSYSGLNGSSLRNNYESSNSNASRLLAQKAAMQQVWLEYLKMDPMNCIIEPKSGNKGGLYLGNIDAAQNIELLKKHNIGAVLTVAARTGLTYQKHQVHAHEVIKADDVESFDLRIYFSKITQFIEENIQHTNVLVHCFAGVSRSATAVIAYLMKCCGLSFDRALQVCKTKRKVTNPNPGFVRQLLLFENTLAKSQQKKESREEWQIERKPAYEKEDYIKEEPSYLRNHSYQNEYLKSRSDQLSKDNSYQKKDFSNARGDIYEKKTDSQRQSQQKLDKNDKEYYFNESTYYGTKSSAKGNNEPQKIFNKTFSSGMSVQVDDNLLRDKRKTLDEEYQDYLDRTRKHGSTGYKQNSTEIKDELKTNKNIYQSADLRGRITSNQPTSEKVIKDDMNYLSERPLRQNDVIRGYSAAARSSGRNADSINDNVSKSFLSKETNKLNFMNDFSSKYDYKNDVASRDISKIGSSESKGYYTTVDSRKQPYDYVPYYKNRTIESRDLNDKTNEIQQNQNTYDSYSNRSRQSQSAYPKGYTSLLSSPLPMQYLAARTEQPLQQSYSPTQQPSVISKYSRNLSNSSSLSKYDSFFPSNKRISEYPATQLRSSFSSNFYSPYSTFVPSTSYRQASSQFSASQYSSKIGIY